MNYDSCTIKDKRKIISLSENNKKFQIENKSGVIVNQLKVDDCLIKGSEIRCDWIVHADSPCKRIIYIELKGCDIAQAVRQIEATLIKTRDKFSGYKKECFVVGSRMPRNDTSTRRAMDAFYKKNGISLSVRTNQVAVVI